MGNLEELKQEALSLNIVFEDNITYEDLLQQVEAKKEEQKKQNGDSENSKDIIVLFRENKEIVKTLKAEDLEVLCKAFELEYVNTNDAKKKLLSLKFDGDSENSKDKDILIKRVSKCGNYTAKIKGLEETARRSGVSAGELEKVLGTGKLLNNYTFEIIETKA